MSQWYENQMKPSGDFRKLPQERIDKANLTRMAAGGFSVGNRTSGVDVVSGW